MNFPGVKPSPSVPPLSRMLWCGLLALMIHAALFVWQAERLRSAAAPGPASLQVQLSVTDSRPATVPVSRPAPLPPRHAARPRAIANGMPVRPSLHPLAMPSARLAVSATASQAAPMVTGPVSTAEPRPADCPQRTAPAYPRLARRAGEQGSVTLRFEVGETGQPQAIRVETSSGFVRLDQAAIETVRQWRCQAPSGEGELRQTVHFSLQSAG